MISLTQSNFNGGEVSPEIWNRSDLEKWGASARSMVNFLPRVRGSVENRGGTHFIYPSKLGATRRARLYHFQFSVVQWYIIEFGHQYIRFYKDDGVIVSSGTTPYELASTYTESQLPLLKFEQSADVLYIFHPEHVTRRLTRTAHNSWTLTDNTNGPQIAAPTGFAITGATGTKREYGVTAVNSEGSESVMSNTAASNYNSSLVFNWTASAGAVYYNVYEKASGVWAYIGQSETTSYTMPDDPPIRETGQRPRTPNTPFTSATNYPGCGAFFEQRLWYARTDSRPQTIWGSVTGDFHNLNKATPSQDDDSVQFTLNSTSINEIKWMVGLEEMLIGTSAAEWVMKAGSRTSSVTPSSVDLKVKSRWGSSDIPPVVIGDSVLFVDGSQRHVRELGYSLERDGYAASDMTVLAEHLFEHYKIEEMAYQRFPDSTLWMVREDGTLCGLTYHKEHKVYGWHRHETDGAFESVASVITEAGESQTWVIVRREIDGNTVRYIERFDLRDFTAIEDAFFVDCGLTYEGSPATIISGLDHLEGKAVAVLADGNVVDGLEVQLGQIVLPVAASKVHVGLPYVSEMETIGFDMQTQNGNLLDKSRQVTNMILRVRESREVWYASAPGREFFELKFRTTEDYGEPTEPFTGDKQVAVPASGMRDARIIIQVRNPVPLTLDSISTRLDFGDS